MLPLDAVKVVDLSRVLAGPYATMMLADLGADVVKVERAPGGDDSRRFGPHVNGESLCFAAVNRNKQSIGLDLKNLEGRQVALRLLDSADIVVENFRPGVTERLGLDYPAVRARNESIIYCSITGFGQSGPYKHRPGYDIIAQGITGLMRMTGAPGGEPTKVGIAVNDIAAGATAVQAMLAAYIHRLRTGTGQYIDLSLVDSALAWTVWESAAYFGSEEIALPTGTRHRRTAPYQAYRTCDGYITIGGNTEQLWQKLCTEVLERPELLEDPRYRDATARLEHVDELEVDIEAALAPGTTEQWVRRLDDAGVPGGPVYTYDETLADAQVLARDMVVEVEHPTIGRTKSLGLPIKYSETPLSIRRPAPVLGEHSISVLRAAGFETSEIDSLIEKGVLILHGGAGQDA